MRDKLIRYISDCSAGDGEIVLVRDYFFCMSEDSSDSDDDKEASTEETKEKKTAKLFHRDEDGKVTFTEAEAYTASSFIAAMNIDGRVKASKFDDLFVCKVMACLLDCITL